MKLGKALSTGYAQDAYEHDADRERTAPEEPAERRAPDRCPAPVEATAEPARPRRVVDAAAR